MSRPKGQDKIVISTRVSKEVFDQLYEIAKEPSVFDEIPSVSRVLKMAIGEYLERRTK